MTHVTYEIVEHDDGWAYKVGDTFSETFSSHQDARVAATKAAVEHQQGGSDEEIQFQTSKGEWREEHADGGDRPETSIADKP